MASMCRVVLRFAFVSQALGLQVGAKGGARLASSTPSSPLGDCRGFDCVKAYVDLPDPSYSWYDTGLRFSGVDDNTSVSWNAYVLNMTSQTWETSAMPASEHVLFPVWWHILIVIIPSNLDSPDWANMIVEPGVLHADIRKVEHVSNRQAPDDLKVMLRNQTLYDHLQIDRNDLLDMMPKLKLGVYKSAYLATHTRSVGVSLFSSMNDYQVFFDDETQQKRTDEDVKAYTWIDFMKHGDLEPERIIELPVAKAGARALDTVAAFTAQLPSGQVKRFGVMGHSKYGTCTWMLAALGDERIKAIAPEAMPPNFSGINVSLLSTGGSIRTEPEAPVLRELVGMDAVEDLKLQHEISDAVVNKKDVNDTKVDPYSTLGMYWQNSSELYQVVDPASWLDRITVPTLYVQDTSDRFFDKNVGTISEWLGALSCPKNVLMVEEVHETVVLGGLSGVAAFFRGQMLGQQMPEIEFQFKNHAISVTQKSAHTPRSVRLHYGNSCATHGSTLLHSSFYRGGEIAETSPGNRSWVAKLDIPEVMSFNEGVVSCEAGLGPKAAFVVVEYDGPQPGYDPYKFSTPLYFDE